MTCSESGSFYSIDWALFRFYFVLFSILSRKVRQHAAIQQEKVEKEIKREKGERGGFLNKHGRCQGEGGGLFDVLTESARKNAFSTLNTRLPHTVMYNHAGRDERFNHHDDDELIWETSQMYTDRQTDRSIRKQVNRVCSRPSNWL